MDKKLPKVFANQIDRPIKNNETVYYGSDVKNDKEERGIVSKRKIVGASIYQKINNIFNSTNYIYKADVELKINGKKVNKRIVGKNNSHLITFDNELIAISEIEDINFAK